MTKRQFFQKMSDLGLALTFDDVRLKTGLSQIKPAEADLTTSFARGVTLKTPIVSAAMDTVTEAPMAIAMAQAGGLGVIHRNLSPREQARAVARVKFYLNGLIEKPITVSATDTVADVLKLRTDKNFSFHSFPVIDANGRLAGLITRNDIELCPNLNWPVEKIMSTDLVTASAQTSIDQAYKLMQTKKRKLLPLVRAGRLVGLYVWSDVKRIKTHTGTHNLDRYGQLKVAAAIGTGSADLERAAGLIDKKVDVLVIDTAHGDSRPVVETLKQLKKTWPAIPVVVGNITEGDSAKRLVKAGADGLKIGQGPGSICTTRIVAGVGCPQVTAIYNCAQAVAGSGVPISADGGIKNSGDITIAIAAGADNVMLGRLLAGAEEAPGEISVINGVTMKRYRGMGSLAAMAANQASRDRYSQGNDPAKLIPEGVVSAIPYQGPVSRLLEQYLGGLRAGMGYTGLDSIDKLKTQAGFYRLSQAGQIESHPHDLAIIEETKIRPDNHSTNQGQ